MLRHQSSRPVFYDEERWRAPAVIWVLRTLIGLAVLATIAGLLSVIGEVHLPILKPPVQVESHRSVPAGTARPIRLGRQLDPAGRRSRTGRRFRGGPGPAGWAGSV